MKKDLQVAVEWWEKGARHKSASAMFNLGMAYGCTPSALHLLTYTCLLAFFFNILYYVWRQHLPAACFYTNFCVISLVLIDDVVLYDSV